MPDTSLVPVPSRNYADVLKSLAIPEESANLFSDVILPFELKPHQIRSLHGGLFWSRFGLYDEARTGKTIVMQLLAIYFSRFNMRTLFLMPPILFTQFVEAFKEIQGHKLKIEVLDGAPSSKRAKLLDWAAGRKVPPTVLITTREMFSGPFGSARKSAALLNHECLQSAYQCLTWDECHLGLQDESSKVFKSVESFINAKSNHRLILSTGTPISSKLWSAYPHIRLKTPSLYSSRRHFDVSHVIYENRQIRTAPTAYNPEGLRNIQTIAGYTNTATLSEALYAQATRARKLEVLDMKAPNIQIVPITLTAAHYQFYNQTLMTRLVELGDNEILDLRQEQELRQFALRIITNPGFGGKKIANNSIVEAIKTLIEGAGPDGTKVAIFANFTASVKFLYNELKDYCPALVFGENSAAVNSSEVHKFRTTSSCRVIVINPQAGGVGIKLGDVCQTAIFAEPVSSPAVFDQAASRVMLDGQVSPVSIYLLRVLKTASGKAIDVMLGRAKEVGEVLKDKKTILADLLPPI